MAKRALDSSTKADTTGHEWDGVTELNKPLPKWWLWTFYATIVWAIGYWLLMPAWPLLSWVWACGSSPSTSTTSSGTW